MVSFTEFLDKLEAEEHKQRLADLFAWIDEEFPNLDKKVGWNQPMYTNHGTYIIGFSASKKHIAVAPEKTALNQFETEIAAGGYEATKEIFRIKWSQPVDYTLLKDIIQFNIDDKADYTTFWRK
ncbi:MAG: DUF1801 domain-containing protein [Alkalibacterium sp.]|nr:DUF1801 domain-containing protein [Alkalibacterium sp.]TVP90702.1 MAG: iron chaperone [Alkalibacterium sp.]